jgi:hypothetical protein
MNDIPESLDISESLRPEIIESLGRVATYLVAADDDAYLCAEIVRGRVSRWRAVDARSGDELPVVVKYFRDGELSRWDIGQLRSAAALLAQPEATTERGPLPQMDTPDGGSGGGGGGGGPISPPNCPYVCAALPDGGSKCWRVCR